MMSILAATAVTASLLVPGAAPKAEPAMSCTPKAYPVTVGQGVPATMSGQLCSRGPAAGKKLIITMPGSTYRPLYFDWPQDPARYSFAWSATLAGFAVLTMGELGSPPGSSYPPVANLTISDNAQALHQVIAAQQARHIIVMGHSVGSYIAWTENSVYGDPSVDGLIITGALHPASDAGRTAVSGTVEPAQDWPAFKSLPSGYLTTRPGTRAASFYAPGDYDPAVVAEDEQTKGITSGPTLASIAAAEDPAVTRGVKVPALLEDGAKDKINCLTSDSQPSLPCSSASAVLTREHGDWGGPVSAFVLPGSGHDLTTASNGYLATATAIFWALLH